MKLGFILDASVVLIILVFMLIGYKKGFISAFLNIVGGFVALLLSFWLSDLSTVWLYNAYIKEDLITTMKNEIVKYSGNGLSSIDNALGFLPNFIEKIISKLGVDLKLLEEQAIQSGNDFANTLAISLEKVVGAVIMALIYILVVIIIFIVLLFLIRAIAKGICKLFELPILKQVNSLISLIFGTVTGAIVVLLIVGILKVAVPYNNEPNNYLNAHNIEKSYLYEYIYNFAPQYKFDEKIKEFIL